jgi:3-hydroxymyristoyl/3-hydroxydecanoyl-(acyl carrier protein) dehydratase
MSERFSAFSFVDRITSFEPGVRATGRYTIPPGVDEFPPALVAEAVGQLAAWAAMSRLDFAFRPVAGLAGELAFLRDAAPGQTLDLTVAIEHCDEEAIAYDGTASVDGVRVLTLEHSVGPMLPMDEFDAPGALRADLAVLRGPGAPGGRFRGVPARAVTVIERAPGERWRAELQVPAAAPFFGDHFPRRPVFPGTLLLDTHLALAAQLAAETAPLRDAGALRPARAIDMKMRAFIPPGQVLELRFEVRAATPAGATIGIATRANGKSVSTGRAEIAPRAR